MVSEGEEFAEHQERKQRFSFSFTTYKLATSDSESPNLQMVDEGISMYTHIEALLEAFFWSLPVPHGI